MSEIVNKIKASRLETVDLEEFLKGVSVNVLDIRQFLFKEMILKESEFRDHLNSHDWSQYEGEWLAVTCTSDAIIPSWAWMLVTAHAGPYAEEIIYGDESDARMALLKQKINQFDWSIYTDKFVLLKGCSKADVPAGAYLEATKMLLPITGKLMYGEACSNVPVYRKPRK
ncbi:MAG: DUF2480 family protein [Balneolaceae bacterium]